MRQYSTFNIFDNVQGALPRQKSKPQTFVHIVIDRFSIFFTFFRKFVIEWLLNIPPNLNCSDYSA